MKQSANSRTNPKPDLINAYLGNGNRMKNIRFTAFPAHGLMRFCRDLEGRPDQVLIAWLKLRFQHLQQGTVFPEYELLLLFFVKIILWYVGKGIHDNCRLRIYENQPSFNV